MDVCNKFKACLLGGAIGDALGYSIEFMSLNEMKSKYGSKDFIESMANKLYYTYNFKNRGY